METIKFEELQLDDRILRAVGDMGFEAVSYTHLDVYKRQAPLW